MINKIRTKRGILLLFVVSVLVGCSDDDSKEIEKKINAGYGNGGWFHLADSLQSTYLSKEVCKLIDSTEKICELDAELIKKSDYPTDKPYCPLGETDIFQSNFYDGYSSFKIEQVAKEEHNKIRANIHFYHNPLDSTEQQTDWVDTLIFVKENSLKLDNVLYYNKNSTSNLKNELIQMINNYYK